MILVRAINAGTYHEYKYSHVPQTGRDAKTVTHGSLDMTVTDRTALPSDRLPYCHGVDAP
jgi:hypothetical protein